MNDRRDEGPLGWEDEDEERWEHRRDPDLEPEGEPGPRRPQDIPVPRIGSRYTAVLGVLFLLILIGAGVNTFNNRDACILAINCRAADLPLSEFAVADARGSVKGDANIAQDDCETSQLPCPADRRRTPACKVRGAGVIRVCDMFDRPSVISFWFTRGAPGCVPQQDVVDRVARRYRGKVKFLSLDVRDTRGKVRGLIADRGWTMPVGLDTDGAVSNLYRIGGCPTITYAYPGGILKTASRGELDQSELSRRVQRLIAASRQRESAGD
jgi:hypothetical protein